MPTELINLELDELSLVPKGANQMAKAPIFKALDGDVMTENVTKMSDDMKAKLKPYMDKGMSEEEAMKAYEAGMKKSLEDEVANLKKENQRLRKALIEEGYVIKAEVIEKKAPVEMVEVGGVSVVKADIPEPVLKALEEAEVAKKQHEIEKADIELTKMAGEVLPHFAVDVAKSLLKSFSDEEIIMEALKAADAAFEAAMQEFGKSDANGEFATATDKLDAMVKSYMDQHNMKKSEFAKAYAAVAKTDEGKSLINKSYKGE